MLIGKTANWHYVIVELATCVVLGLNIALFYVHLRFDSCD